MFRHQGKSRTFKHNLQIATVLSFVAGIVNVAGFLAFRQLTTNVTGHFAVFISDVAEFEWWKGSIFFLYIFSFLFGSFLSSFLIEQYRENKQLNVFVLPTVIEVLVLLAVGISSNFIEFDFPNFVVCSLLFAMGLQNSFVTKISNAVVRTTHLTGLFTDMGIEFSQLFFYKDKSHKQRLIASIKLRLTIIFMFFAGGLCGGILFDYIQIKTLILGAVILLGGLFFDFLKIKLLLLKRKK